MAEWPPESVPGHVPPRLVTDVERLYVTRWPKSTGLTHQDRSRPNGRQKAPFQGPAPAASARGRSATSMVRARRQGDGVVTTTRSRTAPQKSL